LRDDGGIHAGHGQQIVVLLQRHRHAGGGSLPWRQLACSDSFGAGQCQRRIDLQRRKQARKSGDSALVDRPRIT
jgi:hypothetical protein